jgi:tetratricopeptide (TPR) repeat protein
MVADSLRAAGWARIFIGEAEKAVALLREAYAISLKLNNLWGEADCAFKLAQALLETGAYGTALKLARQGVAGAQTIKHPHLIVLNMMALGSVQRTLLALAEAREILLQAKALQDEAPVAIFADWTLRELCAVEALSGNWQMAYEYVKRLLITREEESEQPISLCGSYEIEALLHGGEASLARAEVARQEQQARNPRYRLMYLRSLAVLTEWDGDALQAIAHLEEALTLAAGMGLPGEQWPILAKLAKLYAKETRAGEVKSQALAIVNHLAEQIEDEEVKTIFSSTANSVML